MVNANDPVVANLLALAVEFETKAVALAAQEVTEKQIEQVAPENPEGVLIPPRSTAFEA